MEVMITSSREVIITPSITSQRRPISLHKFPSTHTMSEISIAGGGAWAPSNNADPGFEPKWLP
eukprot:16450823-Heterocapsa_arctica.AAC.1